MGRVRDFQGGVFNNYAAGAGSEPGDPSRHLRFPDARPRPEQLIYAITLLQEKISKDHGSFKRTLNLA